MQSNPTENAHIINFLLVLNPLNRWKLAERRLLCLIANGRSIGLRTRLQNCRAVESLGESSATIQIRDNVVGCAGESEWHHHIGGVSANCWHQFIGEWTEIFAIILLVHILNVEFFQQSSAEWTCIAIGLSTGSVQFYCDSGFELCTQTWHTEPVHSIKPQTGKKITEELHVTYETCVCIVSGQQLVQTLRFHRYQMQKGIANNRRANVFGLGSVGFDLFDCLLSTGLC